MNLPGNVSAIQIIFPLSSGGVEAGGGGEAAPGELPSMGYKGMGGTKGYGF